MSFHPIWSVKHTWGSVILLGIFRDTLLNWCQDKGTSFNSSARTRLISVYAEIMTGTIRWGLTVFDYSSKYPFALNKSQNLTGKPPLEEKGKCCLTKLRQYQCLAGATPALIEETSNRSVHPRGNRIISLVHRAHLLMTDVQAVALPALKCEPVPCQTAYPALFNFNENHSSAKKRWGSLQTKKKKALKPTFKGWLQKE